MTAELLASLALAIEHLVTLTTALSRCSVAKATSEPILKPTALPQVSFNLARSKHVDGQRGVAILAKVPEGLTLGGWNFLREKR